MANANQISGEILKIESRGEAGLRTVGTAVAASLLVAICSHLSLPLFFTPVPLTLQPFAVILIGLMLNPATAFAALMMYLIEGASGLPVFTPQGLGGMHQLFGLTGGYLLSYPFAAAATSWVKQRMTKNFSNLALSATAGNIIILMGGALWLMACTHAALKPVLAQTVVPFLPGDALKIVAAAGIATGLTRIRKQA